MADYIEREDVLKILNKKLMTKDIAIGEIKNLPTADVVEVKHGEWLKIVKDIGKCRTLTHYKCSLCGVYVSDKTNYCYHCGSKMDGRRDT